jgi:hypothetical protein
MAHGHVDDTGVQLHGHRLVEREIRWSLELGDRSVPDPERSRLSVGRSEPHRVRGDLGGAVEGGGFRQPAILAAKVDDQIEDPLRRTRTSVRTESRPRLDRPP